MYTIIPYSKKTSFFNLIISGISRKAMTMISEVLKQIAEGSNFYVFYGNILKDKKNFKEVLIFQEVPEKEMQKFKQKNREILLTKLS